MKHLSAFALFIAGIACSIPQAMAQNDGSAAQHTVKKASTKKAAAKKQARAEEREKEPDLDGMLATKFDCELGNKLTIYTDANNDQQIALRWNKHVHQLTRVGTTTGANRFENTKEGLVWIGIPAKGMLLDSKKGQQLANECKNTEQAQKAAEKN